MLSNRCSFCSLGYLFTISLRFATADTPWTVPYNNRPMTFPNGYNPMLPAYPNTHAFTNGVDIGVGNQIDWDFDISFPALDKPRKVYYPWDLDLSGGVSTGGTKIGYGHVLHPIKGPYVEPISDVYTCLISPELCQQQRAQPAATQTDPNNPGTPDGEKHRISPDDTPSFLRGPVKKRRYVKH